MTEAASIQRFLRERFNARRKRSAAVRFWEKVDRRGPNECWRWLATLGRGYGRFMVSKRPPRQVHPHHFAWLLLRGPVPKGQVVRHRCRHKWCVNPRHSRLGTHTDNMHDMALYGEASSGAAHWTARRPGEIPIRKLTVRQVSTIKRLLALGVSGAALAARFSVSTAHISRIKCGGVWRTRA